MTTSDSESIDDAPETMAPSGYDPNGETWFATPPEDPGPMDEKDEPTIGPDPTVTVEGPEASFPALPEITGDSGDDESGAGESGAGEVHAQPADEAADVSFDPCGAVPVAEWRAWTGASEAAQIVLEPAETCGYTEPRDQVRMTVSFLPASGTERFLDDAGRADASPVTEGAGLIRHPAYYVLGTPVPFASSLIVELDDMDVVVAVYNRDPDHSDEDLRSAAIRWAGLAEQSVAK